MSDEDEEDYMSDKFLAGIADVKPPSLINNRATKRQINVKHKQKEDIKRQRETKSTSNNDRLQEALSKPLESENKGFMLLAKMGYKPGQALGKKVDTEASSLPGHDRLIEPIGITIKSDRQGLGRETALKELKQKQMEIRMQRLKKDTTETSIEEFRKRANQKAEERFVGTALRRCQKTCQNLDIDLQIITPAMPWFWPEVPKEEPEDAESTETKNQQHESEDEAEEEFSNFEKLEMLTSYIRTSYNFCYWCGVRYESVEDLSENCPGLTKDDH